MTTAYITDTRYLAHTLPGHVENAARLQATLSRLDEAGVPARMLTMMPESASDEQILTVHTEEYLDLLKWSETQRGVQFGPDTYVLPQSFGIARLSCGASLRAVNAVCTGETANALACARPPGHHATADMAMGFCLLANISIAAHHARNKHHVGRIMIVDYDVHHGNGTHNIFYEDPNVLFISTHQSPWYPYTGRIDETGEGKGEGATINIPLPVGVGDAGFAQVFREIIWPAARRFQPELILVSAGFDSHWADPLGGLTLSLAGYAHITRELIRMAGELCGGRIIFVLEGGYHLEALSNGVLNVAYALLGDDQVSDPLGLSHHHEPDISTLVGRIRAIHSL